MADITHISINNTSYDIKDAKAARKGMYVGTCPTSATINGSTVTMASSPDKVVTVDTFPTDANNKPLVGTVIGVKYATTNTYKTDLDNNKPEAPHRINVNNTGFIQIYYNNAALKSGTSANSLAAGYKNRYIYYQYDGTYWVWLSAGTDTNTTYSGYSFGLGLGVQNNASASATITVTLSNYALATGGVTAVRFLYDVPASATMNINSKGAKSIYYNNSAITAGIIKAGDTATFVYSGQYHLISIDRWDTDIKAKANSADLAAVATSGSYNDLTNKPTIPAAVTVDSSLTGSSQTNPVQGGAIYTALQGKEDRQRVIVDIQCDVNQPIGYSVGGNTITGAELYALCADPKKDVVLRIIGYDNNEDDDPDYSDDILYYRIQDSLSEYEEQFYASWWSGMFLLVGLCIESEGANIYFEAGIEEFGYVPTIRKINNKALSSDITLTASDVGADVFVVNISATFSSGTSTYTYTSSKTFTEIYNAILAKKHVIAVFEIAYYTLTYCENGATIIFSDGASTISIESDSSVHYYEFNYQSALVSGTNIKTINNQSLLGSGNLTASDIGVPSIANNLTTTTVGSALDATKGKALNDQFAANETIFGKLVSGSFYIGFGVGGSWVYQAQAVSLESVDTTKTFVDVPNNKFYYYNGSAFVELGVTDISGKADKNGSATEDFNVRVLQLNDYVDSTKNGWIDYEYISANQIEMYFGDNVNNSMLRYQFPTDGSIKTIATIDDVAEKTLYTGKVVGKMHRDNVGGSGNFTISGNTGYIPNVPAGTYIVEIWSKSATSTFSYTFNIGSVSYTLSTTNGILHDKRTVTLASAGTFSGSVSSGSVASGTELIVTFYSFEVPATHVGIAAVTNSYQDLDDKPTIPTVNNGTLTIQKNGTNVQTFTANQSSNATANIECAEPLTVVTNSNTGSVSQAMDAGKFYKFTGAVTALTLTFNSATNLAIYAGKFTSDSSTATTITLPSGYTSASSNPTIETGESYEFSVMDNVFLMVKL